MFIAVKAGGMRITQHKTTHSEKPATEPKKETEEDEGEEQLEEAQAKPSPVVISGVVARVINLMNNDDLMLT